MAEVGELRVHLGRDLTHQGQGIVCSVCLASVGDLDQKCRGGPQMCHMLKKYYT